MKLYEIGLYVGIVVLCVTSAGLASGLTQGMLSLDILALNVKERSGSEREKRMASRILPIVKNHNLLLVSLLLWNATAAEVLPLFLNRLVPEYMAIIISVTLVLFVGEIIPTALFTGPKKLDIAYFLSGVVIFVMGVFFLLAYPISRILDYALGTDEGLTIYNRMELSTMIKIQYERISSEMQGHETRYDSPWVDVEETQMIGGVLGFRDIEVQDIMTTDPFMLLVHRSLTAELLNEIFRSGYSRVPVYEKDRNDIVGLILVKDLLFVNPDDPPSIGDFLLIFNRTIEKVWIDQKLPEVLKIFRQSRCHMAMVKDVNTVGQGDPYYEVMGIVTLEDLFEHMLGQEIYDETDIIDDGYNMYTKHHRNLDTARINQRHKTNFSSFESKSEISEMKHDKESSVKESSGIINSPLHAYQNT